MRYLSALGLVAALASASYAASAQTPSTSPGCTHPGQLAQAEQSGVNNGRAAGQLAQAEQSGVNNGRAAGQLAQAEQSGVNNGRGAGQFAQNMTGAGNPCR